MWVEKEKKQNGFQGNKCNALCFMSNVDQFHRKEKVSETLSLTRKMHPLAV